MEEPGAEIVGKTTTEDTADEDQSLPAALAEADLTLADETGEALDLASTDSAESLKAPDPYYKVGKTYYRFFESATGCDAYPGEKAAGTCFDGEPNPIQAAINYVPTSGLPTDRKIYVETGTYTGGAYFDATTTAILGQLNGLIGEYDSETESRPVINGDVVLWDNIGGFTLSGFTINGQFATYDGIGTLVVDDVGVTNSTGDGIYASHHDGNVEIKNTTASNNQQRGAYINNGDPGNKFSVTIKNSSFDENGLSYGNVNALEINTLGKVMMENVSASRNRGSGIRIASDFTGLTIKNAILISNDATPDDTDFGHGLYAQTGMKANITLDTIMAADQHDNVMVIRISTAGSVTGNSITSYHNAGMGMWVNNLSGTGSVKITEAKFIYNGNKGLMIQSNGPITLTSIQASNNTGNGLEISAQNTVTITSPKNKGFLFANQFSNNTGVGLSVTTVKNISITNVNADDNGGTGIYLSNYLGTGNVSLKKNLPTSLYSTFYNTAHRNGGDGLDIDSSGSVQVEYLNADENDLNGFSIDNDFAAKTPGIKVLYSETLKNAYFGMELESKGSIALTNISASENGTLQLRDGLSCKTVNGTSGGVTISSKNGYINTFNLNSRRGFDFNVLGNVSLKNVAAVENDSAAYIVNNLAASNRYVKISGGDFSNTLTDGGIEVYSKGNISLDAVYANDNDRDGAILHNAFGAGTVTVKNSAFNGNDTNYGLEVRSLKNITLYNVQAIGNNNYGVFLDNCTDTVSGCAGTGSISITSGKNTYNIFAMNGFVGAYLESKGNITLSNIIASENGSAGMTVFNTPDATSGNVTLSSGNKMRNSFDNNASHGLFISSFGNISVSNTDVFGNQINSAAFFTNSLAPTAKYVKVKDSTFLRNEQTGLKITSLGTITLQGVDASDNSVYEGSFDILGDGINDVLSSTYEHDAFEFTATAPGNAYNVTLNSLFFDAYLELRGPDGALIDSDDNSGGGTDAAFSGTVPAAGDYTIHVMSADGFGSGRYSLNLNSGSYNQYSFRGMEIDNSGGTAAVKVLYSNQMGYGVRAWNNSYDGVRIDSNGSVSITRADVMQNGLFGIWINNEDDSEGFVTLNTVNSTMNQQEGIYVTSRGNITLAKVTATGNRRDNANIVNNSASKERWVKVNSSIFSESLSQNGIWITSKGNVTLTNVEAQNPDGISGASIDNTYGSGSVTINGKLNTFNNNNSDGLYILSHGEISLTNVLASFNGSDGIYARNGYSGYDAKNIKLTATGSKFMNSLLYNGGEGFSFLSFGTVTINKAETVGNANGSHIEHSSAPDFKKITITNSVFNESFTLGLSINAYGPVYLTNIWAENNTTGGIVINSASAADQDVYLKALNVNDNGDHGLWVDSAGFIKADKSTFVGNGQSGAYLQNSSGTEAILVQNTIATHNQTDGLNINSNGALTIKSTISAENQGNGIYFDGNDSGEKVVLTNVQTVINYSNGIALYRVADVSISGSSSMANGSPSHNSNGLYIDSNGAGVVTVSKSSFLSNFNCGIRLLDVATFTSSNTTIFGNDIDGSGDGDYFGP